MYCYNQDIGFLNILQDQSSNLYFYNSSFKMTMDYNVIKINILIYRY